jgi:hypothetical protein
MATILASLTALAAATASRSPEASSSAISTCSCASTTCWNSALACPIKAPLRSSTVSSRLAQTICAGSASRSKLCVVMISRLSTRSGLTSDAARHPHFLRPYEQGQACNPKLASLRHSLLVSKTLFELAFSPPILLSCCLILRKGPLQSP